MGRPSAVLFKEPLTFHKPRRLLFIVLTANAASGHTVTVNGNRSKKPAKSCWRILPIRQKLEFD